MQICDSWYWAIQIRLDWFDSIIIALWHHKNTHDPRLMSRPGGNNKPSKLVPLNSESGINMSKGIWLKFDLIMNPVICVTIRLLSAPLAMNEGVTASTENVCMTFYTRITFTLNCNFNRCCYGWKCLYISTCMHETYSPIIYQNTRLSDSPYAGYI